MKKKLTALFLALVMCMTMSVPAFAENTTSICDSLNNLADEIIQSESYVDASGTTFVTYTCLKDFVNEARLSNPELSDYQIADFILAYTGQDSEIIPNDKKMDILGYESFVVSISNTIDTSTNGVAPLAVYDDPDGMMQIVTTYALQDTVNGEKYYDVWATAFWKLFPTFFDEDCFTIGGTAEYNSNADKSGRFSEKTKCAACGKVFSNTYEVDDTDPYGDNIYIGYDGGFPAIYFEPSIPTCSDSCDSGFTRQNLSTYISFGVICNGSKNIQAAYGHKKVSLGSLSLSFDLRTGAPSFSVNGSSTKVDNYTAEPVTLSGTL